jgi:hypothetical protein
MQNSVATFDGSVPSFIAYQVGDGEGETVACINLTRDLGAKPRFL